MTIQTRLRDVRPCESSPEIVLVWSCSAEPGTALALRNADEVPGDISGLSRPEPRGHHTSVRGRSSGDRAIATAILDRSPRRAITIDVDPTA